MLGYDGELYDDEDLDDGLLISYQDMEKALHEELMSREVFCYRVEKSGNMPVFIIEGDILPMKILCDAPKDYYFLMWGTSIMRFSFLQTKLLGELVLKLIQGEAYRFEIRRGLTPLYTGYGLIECNASIMEELKKENPEFCDSEAYFDYYEFGRGLVSSKILTKDTE